MKLVETIHTVYQALFTIHFEHNAYTPQRNTVLADDITVYPDKITRKYFAGYEIDFQFFNTTIKCFIRCSLLSPPQPVPKRPFRIMQDDLRLRFLLKPENGFFNVTDILRAGAKQVYYFSNRSNAQTDMFISSSAAEVGDSDIKNIDLVNPDESCFGVIDIFSSNAVNGNYELFATPGQQMRSPDYKIRFKSLI